MLKKIILDTNFLMIPGSLKVDIFSEISRICDFRHELCVLDSTIKELEQIIERQQGRHRESANMALKLIRAKDLKIISSPHDYTDEALLALADLGAIIATQDRALKSALKKKKADVIFLRQKKYLALG